MVKLPGKNSATIIKPKTNEHTKTHKKPQQKTNKKRPTKHKTIPKHLRRCCQAQATPCCFIYQQDFLMTLLVWCGGCCGCRMLYAVNIISPPVNWCQLQLNFPAWHLVGPKLGLVWGCWRQWASLQSKKGALRERTRDYFPKYK